MVKVNNIFLSGEIKVYGGWNLIDERKFNQAELKFIKTAVVAASDFGKSVQFTFVTGQQAFIELSSNSEAPEIGTPIDPTKISVLTLAKPGEKDIIRVKINE